MSSDSSADPRKQLSVPLLALTLLLILVLLAIILYRRKSNALSKNLPTTLLLGQSGTGKTRLFSYLRYQETLMDTQPSLECHNSANSPDSYRQSQRQRIVDIPGHPRLRLPFFRQELPNVKRIVFLINYQPSQTRDFHDTTEYLYNIISRLTLAAAPVSILVAVNQVQPAFLGQIRKRIEAEFENIRQSLAANQRSLNSTTGDAAVTANHQDEDDDASVGNVYLGFDDGKPFTFDQLDSQVTRLEFTSADNYSIIRNWIMGADSSLESGAGKKEN
jgi:signal recognition particle receptor subunit beta